METRILFFGQLQNAAGGDQKIVELPGAVSDRASLIDWLCEGDELLRDALSKPSVLLCVDKVIVPNHAQFDAPQEVAFLPPLSGG